MREVVTGCETLALFAEGGTCLCPSELFHPSLRYDGDRVRTAARLGQRADRGERLLHAARRRLVRDDVERRVPVDGLLDEPRDGDAFCRELVRKALEDARAVVDREPQVPGRGEVAGREPLELPPDGIVLEEARAARPD